MTVYLLPEDCILFPDPNEAEPDGLLAVGGDLRLNRLVAAYELGIFPWYSDDTPILWWSPDPRCILRIEDLHVAKSLRRTLNSGEFRVTFDRAFCRVIHECAKAPRPQGDGTWLVDEMMRAYQDLHTSGLAHSVEVWRETESSTGRHIKLVGGLYGVSLGSAFFGESMFFKEPSASKVGFVTLVKVLKSWGFTFVDCQQTTPHMLKYGAREVSRDTFTLLLEEALKTPTRRGKWSIPEDCSWKEL